MKLNKIKFAQVISYINNNCGMLSYSTIEDLDCLLDFDIPEAQPVKASCEEIEALMELMVGGTQKIDAIKSYRNLTSAALKDAKEAVERYWVSKPASETAASLKSRMIAKINKQLAEYPDQGENYILDCFSEEGLKKVIKFIESFGD